MEVMSVIDIAYSKDITPIRTQSCVERQASGLCYLYDGLRGAIGKVGFTTFDGYVV